MSEGGLEPVIAEVLSILREDLAQTNGFIDKCDEHMFKVKNWALLTSSAVIAYSVSQHHEAFVFANLAFLFAFIYLELIYKSFQDAAIEHATDISERIDKFLANPTDDTLLNGYQHGFGRTLQYPAAGRLLQIFRNESRRHIRHFYGLLALFSVGAYLVVQVVPK